MTEELPRPISESYWVKPGRLLAGEYPAAAFVGRTRQRLDKMFEAGINTFIDLTLPNELPSYLPVLLDEASRQGIEVQYLRFPILDHNIPLRGTMAAALDAIDNSLAKGRNIYVHCWGGIGRTGTTVGCYLVRHGMSGEQALAQLAEWWKDVPKSKYFPRAPETDRQVAYVLNWWENLPLTPPSPEPPTQPAPKRERTKIDWHAYFTQQANWTRELRAYLFKRAGLKKADRVLEVGCGTGAILDSIQTRALHGLDLRPASLRDARVHAPAAILTCADVMRLPYAEGTFDITYCHFLLLWVKDPLQALLEMKRVTRPGGNLLALAEPDYSARLDEPEELSVLGRWQAESLQAQGADVSLGGRLAELFSQAEIELVETGTIQRRGKKAFTSAEWALEWEVLEHDLAGFASREEIRRLKYLDAQARARGKRILHVPTYFAWGRA
jgi:SAM-dependent methyltransferase